MNEFNISTCDSLKGCGEMRKRAKIYDVLMISLIVHIVFLTMLSFHLTRSPKVFNDVLTVVFLRADLLPKPKIRKPCNGQ